MRGTNSHRLHQAQRGGKRSHGRVCKSCRHFFYLRSKCTQTCNDLCAKREQKGQGEANASVCFRQTWDGNFADLVKGEKSRKEMGCWSMMGWWWRKCFRERAHSERREATDGEKRPREADSSDTPEREGRRWGVKPCVH